MDFPIILENIQNNINSSFCTVQFLRVLHNLNKNYENESTFQKIISKTPNIHSKKMKFSIKDGHIYAENNKGYKTNTNILVELYGVTVSSQKEISRSD